MRWPQFPSCHKNANPVPVWNAPRPHLEPEGVPFRTCSKCGSIHPEDLVAYLHHGARLSEPVWDAGMPAQFYVHNIPNPHAGRTVKVGIEFQLDGGNNVEVPVMGHGPPLTHARWMTVHLLDEFDDESLDELLRSLNYQTPLNWSRDENGVKYMVPGVSNLRH
jgi:hypothetical protein